MKRPFAVNPEQSSADRGRWPIRCAVKQAVGRFAVATIAMGLVATDAVAQEESAAASAAGQSALEEVVVTAERRSQSAQDVPLSLNVLSEDQIQPGGVEGLTDISFKTPNFTLTQFNIAEPQLYMRGIGSTNDSAASDPTVSVFVDDVYIGRPGAAAFDLYDLERIEVLRGPQGTLYGRNVTGGAISIYSKAPANEFESKFGVTVGNYDLSVLRGYISGPIGDNVRGKLSFNRNDHTGYARNLTNGQDLDNAHNFNLRAQAVVDFSDRTSATLSADASRDRTNGDCRSTANMDRADQPSNGAFVAQYLPLMRPDITGPRVCTQAWTQFANRDDSGFGLRVTHDTGWSQLTSISSYRKNEFQWRQELAGMNLPPAPLSVPDDEGQKSWQASQEFRLTGSTERIHWVVGAFGFKEHVDRLANVPNLRIPPIASTYRIWKQNADSTSVAAFGQGTWEFAKGLSLTLGGRYTKDDKEIDQLLLTSNVVTYDLKGLGKSWSRFTPRASIDWRITDDVMAYVTWSEGYKSGAFVSQNATAAAASTPLEPEDARNFEGGIKSQWLDDRLRINATYFDLTVENLQLFRLVAGNLVSENANAKVTGVEAEVSIVPLEGLTIDASVSTMNPRYDGGTFDRKYLARAQKLHWSVSGAYSQSLSGGATLRYGASYVHSGDYFHEATNLQTSYVPSSKFVDANLKYTAASGNWDVSLWGKNLTDEVIVRHLIIGSLAGSNIVYQPPRTYGATVNLYFD